MSANNINPKRPANLFWNRHSNIIINEAVCEVWVRAKYTNADLLVRVFSSVVRFAEETITYFHLSMSRQGMNKCPDFESVLILKDFDMIEAHECNEAVGGQVRNFWLAV